MRILFDQNVPVKLARSLVAHEVSLARDHGWEQLGNGMLLQAAEDLDFECLVTCDRNLSYQQDLRSRRIAIVVLPSGNWRQIRSNLTEIVTAVDGVKPGSFFEFPQALHPKPPRP